MKLTAMVAAWAALTTGLAFAGNAVAAENSKINVSIEATSTDVVGQQFVYELREALGGSSHLAAAATEDESFFSSKS
jgi:c-di-AMP phosphodiesterase-like protein